MLTLDQKYLKTLIESSPDIIIAVDRDGTIIYYNSIHIYIRICCDRITHIEQQE